MANIIKLIKCDERELQARINSVKNKVENIAGVVFLLTTAGSLWCMLERMVALGASSGMAALLALVAYGYSQGIARFHVVHIERHETLVLSVMPKHEQ